MEARGSTDISNVLFFRSFGGLPPLLVKLALLPTPSAISSLHCGMTTPTFPVCLFWPATISPHQVKSFESTPRLGVRGNLHFCDECCQRRNALQRGNILEPNSNSVRQHGRFRWRFRWRKKIMKTRLVWRMNGSFTVRSAYPTTATTSNNSAAGGGERGGREGGRKHR